MKTVIIDNSLCTIPMDDKVKPELIYNYICAMRDAGIKLVELDFRTIMKVNELPDGIKYIFRLGDPMFAELTEVFDFDYVLVTVADLKKPLNIKTPVMIEFPALYNLSTDLLKLAQSQLHGRIEAVRLRGSFEFMEPKAAAAYIRHLKNTSPVPVDICPMNKHKNALDSALKFSVAKVDSLTMCMGIGNNFASIEDFAFTLMSVFEAIPKEINISALCKAAIYHQLVFGKNTGDSIAEIMKVLDADIFGLRNVDTGARVPMKVTLKDKMLLRKSFVSALEAFIDSEEIPDDFAYDITEAIKKYDASIYDHEQLPAVSKKILQ